MLVLESTFKIFLFKIFLQLSSFRLMIQESYVDAKQYFKIQCFAIRKYYLVGTKFTPFIVRVLNNFSKEIMELLTNILTTPAVCKHFTFYITSASKWSVDNLFVIF